MSPNFLFGFKLWYVRRYLKTLLSKTLIQESWGMNFLNPPVLSSVTENLALDKPVTVGKRYNIKHFDPGLAVDGDVSTDMLKCSLTASGEKEAWLTVDLGEVKNIASISLLHGGCK